MSAARTSNRNYYDAFSANYDRGREVGYHKLIDDMAAAAVRRVGVDCDVLEVGCGTGLVLDRVARFARSARGVDVSPGMLERARARGLDVGEGSATALPFADASFDVAYSFKVLAHVPEIATALSEMVRVVRPGGHVVFDVYNRRSVRYFIKRVFGPRLTSASFHEGAISTRFETVAQALRRLPHGCHLEDAVGIRISTLHPAQHRVPVVAPLMGALEWALWRTPLWRWAGFVVFTVRTPR